MTSIPGDIEARGEAMARRSLPPSTRTPWSRMPNSSRSRRRQSTPAGHGRPTGRDRRIDLTEAVEDLLALIDDRPAGPIFAIR